ncbi:MAG: glycosyltransferase family 4 protein [Reyranella sp.]|nr:glycosyltransferase family 4 protein [Reyranella sp.]MBL6650710.1 glycosyltransferase family 4 protein [Reyranella sp.]
MHFLWLTLADPDPATNGQLLYSKGLIDAARDAGASLRVIGLARPDSPRPARTLLGIDWRLADEQPRPSWRRLLSPTPAIAQRGNSANFERLVDEALDERSWDAVVFDSICAGWALGRVLRHCRHDPQPPRIVYLSHNHEVTVARRMEQGSRGLRRLQRKVDRIKVSRLERRLVANATLVTANTPDDCRRFSADAQRLRQGRSAIFLPPGYAGPRLAERTIDATVPRRAIMVGSLDWPIKRIAIEAFLEAGTETLARAGVELQIVGEAEPRYLGELRRRFPSVDFVGRVDDVRPYMRQARLALVPDLLGGFKLKGLDYVFNRLPILAMRVALPGMPLKQGTSIGLFDSHAALADGVLSLIDDFRELNARQARAYDACANRFDWQRIGQHLVRHIMRGGRAPVRAVPDAPSFDVTSPPAPLGAGR